MRTAPTASRSRVQRLRHRPLITVGQSRQGLGHVGREGEKDFEHGRFHPQARVVTERLIEERIFTT